MKKYAYEMVVTRDYDVLSAKALKSIFSLYILCLDRLVESLNQPCDRLPLNSCTIPEEIKQELIDKKFIEIKDGYIHLLKWAESNVTPAKIMNNRIKSNQRMKKMKERKKKNGQ